jgi:tetratricopeptide (TPR) repeat protein
MTALPPSAPMLQQATQCLQAGNFGGAEKILGRLLQTYPADANGLHMLALVRLRQDRHAEAADLLARSIALSPRHALTHLNLAKVHVVLGNDEAAIASFREANRLKPGLVESYFELGNALHRLGRVSEALDAFRSALALYPGDVNIRLALGAALLDLHKNTEAEALFRETIAATTDEETLAKLWNNLGLAQRNRGDHAGALASCETAQKHRPQFTHLDTLRADALDALRRYPEALETLEAILVREPLNLLAHTHYNSLLYRLGREDFLESFDRAPQTPDVRAAKASFLIKHKRPQDAMAIYADLVADEPDEVEYLVGLGISNSMQHQFGPAVTALQSAIRVAPDNANLYAHLANTLLCSGDAQAAAAMAEKGSALAPGDQSCLALLGTAWRAMGDARDETLNGYDHLIRVFDLEPPRGFSDMAAFNAELSGYLDGLHPDTREFIDQSLRGGTQTVNNLFGAGHDLVERIHERITEAITRYIAEVRTGEDHPFVRRRTSGFRMGGSWSSRLKDCGFHANHIHPSGWISSCYYAALPDAVRDETEKQGWIKFGEPSFDAGLADPVRRVVQPRPGRLVLFPSYMWHGTIPFRSSAPRTTIAFDVLPA